MGLPSSEFTLAYFWGEELWSKTADAAHSYATAHLKATEAGLLANR